MIIVRQLYTQSPLRNFCYVAIDSGTGDCLVIDPYDAGPLITLLESEGLHLRGILNTHEHHDHTCGNAGLLEYKKVPVYAHPAAAHLVPGCQTTLADQQKVQLGDASLKVLHTPGHTMAHLSLLLQENGVARAVFSGDTLFNAGVGNCYNGGDPQVLYTSIQQCYQVLDDAVLLYPGHDYLQNNLEFCAEYEPSNTQIRAWLQGLRQNPAGYLEGAKVTTLGQERQLNAFLRLQEPGLRADLGQRFTDARLDSPQSLFLFLRQLRNQW
ncbi:MAG: hydroxyacylglutathione hydrolase [Leptospiraceae bacterium]|nr:hydroxyacylglutathione hydrolase [Leptospiraceae bacterium]